MKPIYIDGQRYEVPDDATLDEIDEATRDPHSHASQITHTMAKALPTVGGIVGGIVGGTAGAPSGPGAIATSAAGAGLLSAAGRAGQHALDQWLGYEKPMSNTDAIKDTVGTGLKDAALTGVAGMGMQVASRALPLAADAARGGARAIEQRILTNKTNPFSKQKAISPEALDEAADRGAFKFFGTSAGAAKRLQAMREAQGAEYGHIIKQLEANGITGPTADSMVRKFLTEKSGASATTMNPSVPNIYQSAAEMTAGKPTTNGALGLSQIEEMKRSAQGMARSAYKQQMPNEVGMAHKDTASILRQGAEDAIAQQARPVHPLRSAIRDLKSGEIYTGQTHMHAYEALPDEVRARIDGEDIFNRSVRDGYVTPSGRWVDYARAASLTEPSQQVQDLASQFVPVKKSLGNIIEASDLADEGMRAAGKRHFFSLPDKAAMIAEFTHSHNPVRAALTGAATHILQTRGPSSAATILRGSSSLAEALAHSPQAVPVGAAVTGPVAAESLPANSLDALLAAIRRKQSPVPRLAQAQ